MAAGNLSACMPVILANEGGLSMIRSDPGNWTGGRVGVGALKGTNMGIAASSHPGLDIPNLTKPQVEAIYDREYWTPAGCNGLPAGLDLSHFDATVNSGLGRSKGWLAKARQEAGADTSALIHAYAAARLTSFKSFKTSTLR